MNAVNGLHLRKEEHGVLGLLEARESTDIRVKAREDHTAILRVVEHILHHGDQFIKLKDLSTNTIHATTGHAP